MPTLINEFFVVTRTSVYHAQAKGEYRADCIKIAAREESRVGIGHDLCKGGMIAIRNELQGYIPQIPGESPTEISFERRVEMVPTWKGHSSIIIALFLTKEEALACLGQPDKERLDRRWIASTKEALKAIGDDHPSFYISYDNERGGLGIARDSLS